MWPINSARGKSSTKSWLRRSRPPQPSKEPEVIVIRTAPTSLDAAQGALQRAQKGRADVRGMRAKTEDNVREAKRLLAENHLAQRIRESYL